MEEKSANTGQETKDAEGVVSAAQEGVQRVREAASAAADRAAESTKNAAFDATQSAKKALIDKLQQSVDKAESNKETRQEPAEKPRKRSRLPILVVVLVLLVAAGAFAMLNPAISSRLTGEDYISTSQLKKAVEMEGLSSAEFVYNGIAEKRKTGTDEVEYRVSYDASVKAGITMGDVDFDVDNKAKVITITLPEIVPSSVSVSMDGLDYMPENPKVEVKEILELCEKDVKEEAERSESFYATAEENLKSVIEALTMPVVGSKGYRIEWAKSQQG
ncbi:MAG: DUF4230 domain-containing protein [Atopobiaceae bacterium]|nr:DUF4230 domain-containing protein [Atopobiaceae bacterium]